MNTPAADAARDVEQPCCRERDARGDEFRPLRSHLNHDLLMRSKLLHFDKPLCDECYHDVLHKRHVLSQRLLAFESRQIGRLP